MDRVLRKNAAEFVGIQEVQNMLEQLEQADALLLETFTDVAEIKPAIGATHPTSKQADVHAEGGSGALRRHLRQMFGLKGVTLPEKYEGALGGLSSVGVEFGRLAAISEGLFEAKLALLVGLLVAVLVLPNTQQIVERFRPNARWLVLIGIVFCTGFLMSGGVSEFLYFQF